MKLFNKVVSIDLSFWILSILSFALGRTIYLGYSSTSEPAGLNSFLIVLLLVTFVLLYQIKTKKCYSFIFWMAMVPIGVLRIEISKLLLATFDSSYLLNSFIMLVGLIMVLTIWFLTFRNISVYPIKIRFKEVLFWLSILFASSFGVTIGDIFEQLLNLNFNQIVLISLTVLLVVKVVSSFTSVNKALLFWASFVFVQQFGDAFGNFLTLPMGSGGMSYSNLKASFACAILILLVLLISSLKKNKNLNKVNERFNK